MAVKKYSLKADGSKNLSENFKVREFRSRDGADEILIDEKLVSLLQKIRDEFGKVNISSAYRTKSYNKKVGGVSNSQHLYGLAADITISPDSRLEECARFAEKLGFTGIGLDSRYQKFIHVDTRKAKSFFRYRSDGTTYAVKSFFETVKYGSKGDCVKLLQESLDKMGYKGADNKKIICDGVFGKNTEFALKSFQKNKGLTADGIAGPKTWAEI